MERELALRDVEMLLAVFWLKLGISNENYRRMKGEINGVADICVVTGSDIGAIANNILHSYGRKQEIGMIKIKAQIKIP